MTTRSVVEGLSCCFCLEDCCFNEGRGQKAVAMLPPEFPTFHTEMFGTKKTESYGIWRNEYSEQSAVHGAVWGIFRNFAFPDLPYGMFLGTVLC